MNNDDNTIELPKRIDGESNPPENNQNIQSEDNIKINNVVENKVETNVAFPSEKEINHENTNNKATEPVNVNIFDQSIDQNINRENHEGEPLFEPIKDIENVKLSQNEDEITNMTTPETPEVETIMHTPDEKQPLVEEALVNNNVIETPTIEDNNNQLNKKIVSVEPIKKEKSKGSPIIGFFALLLILAIILTAFYYFIKMDYIILPDEIKNKIPFFSTTTTTSINDNQNNEEEEEEEEEELSLDNLIGEYTETSLLICPDIEAKLLLNQDNTFSYQLLSFDEENNNCDISEITGNYSLSNGDLKLTPADDTITIGTANYQKVDDKIKIDIVNEEKTVTFTNID
ncbi:MAG: hypothetical protein PHG03_03275 [Bacilli bacterium]|nr:hypothetical protein [Bacilli bacterium]MDD4795563.1 hypothetical protein [Bacilli bacterium]